MTVVGLPCIGTNAMETFLKTFFHVIVRPEPADKETMKAQGHSAKIEETSGTRFSRKPLARWSSVHIYSQSNHVVSSPGPSLGQGSSSSLSITDGEPSWTRLSVGQERMSTHTYGSKLNMTEHAEEIKEAFSQEIIHSGLQPVWKHRMCTAGKGVDFRSRLLFEDVCHLEGAPQNLIIMTRHLASWAWSIEKNRDSKILSRPGNTGKNKNYLAWSLAVPDCWMNTHLRDNPMDGIGPLF